MLGIGLALNFFAETDARTNIWVSLRRNYIPVETPTTNSHVQVADVYDSTRRAAHRSTAGNPSFGLAAARGFSYEIRGRPMFYRLFSFR